MSEWNHATSGKCVAVWDALSKLYGARGSLPDEKTPDTLLDTTTGTLLDFGQRVADNDDLWAALPTQLIPSESQKHEIEWVANDITRSGEADLAPMVATALQGVPRDELRQSLRRVLEECR